MMLLSNAHCRLATNLRAISCGHHSARGKKTLQGPRIPSRSSRSITNDIVRVCASNEEGDAPPAPESDASLKSDKDLAAEEAERLRAAEKFMVVGTGEAECKGCGYKYKPANGDPEYPIAKGTKFNDLPNDWNCPVCGAEKKMFESTQKEIAGFAENQGYGLGTNSMTGEQKSLLIFGSLAAFFVLFLLGYAMN